VGVDVVVIARSAAAQADAQRLRVALRAHWDRIEQICALS
jgi:RNase P protein component